jgi:capsid protein
MIDPAKELQSLQREVRAGFKSYPSALIELGQDPEEVLEEFVEWNKKFDAAKVTFDSDPRRMSQQGLAQNTDTLPKLAPDAKYLEKEEDKSEHSSSDKDVNDNNKEDAAVESDSTEQ